MLSRSSSGLLSQFFIDQYTCVLMLAALSDSWWCHEVPSLYLGPDVIVFTSCAKFFVACQVPYSLILFLVFLSERTY